MKTPITPVHSPVPIQDTADQQVRHLRNQLGWVTRLSTALSSVDNIEDTISIVLAGLISPTGLGYSQVLYFDHNPIQHILTGKYALYHESQASIFKLAEELEEESHYFETHADELFQDGASESDRLRSEAEMNRLSSQAQWVTLFQKLNTENPESAQLKNMVFQTSQGATTNRSTSLFDEVAYWKTPRATTRARLAGRIPTELSALLPEFFVIAPLATKNGLQALFFLDKHLDGAAPASVGELKELEWFCRQATLVMENIEMNTQLGRAYRELKQIDQMKSNFLSIISHELRTPLTAMTGFVELILEGRVGEINENQRTLLARVSKNTGHLNHLVTDLIELAEIEAAGPVEVRVGPVNPLTVLLDTIPKLEQRRREKNVRVIPAAGGDTPRILSDERALSRILFHLLDNAMKFSPENSEVTVRFIPLDTELSIEISDNGVGIADENIEHIFKHFYQVDNSLTRGHEGLGLGLAVTRMLLKSSHGRIKVESEVGKGSTFCIIYPLFSDNSTQF
ncbi:hypothetical protein BH09SUM1_BH09SUM1_06470 [soil metagenome]